MAQTTLNIYAADQIFKWVFSIDYQCLLADIQFSHSIFARVIGTSAGLILGSLAWYIGM